MVQPQAVAGERVDRLREDAVVEDDEGVRDLGAGGAQRLGEPELRAAVGGQILDQQHPRALGQRPLDLRVAAEALGLLADVEHRQAEPLGDPGGEGDARGLAAGDRVELREAGVAQQLGAGEVHQRRPHRRIGDQLAAVDVDRRGEPGGELVGLVAAEVHGPDLEQHARRQPRHLRVGRKSVSEHGLPFSPSHATCTGVPGSNTTTGPAPVSTSAGIATGSGQPLERHPRLVRRQPVERRPVQAREALEPVERPLLLEDLRVGRRAPPAPRSTPAQPQAASLVALACGALSVPRKNRGSPPVAARRSAARCRRALQHRQAVVVRPDAADEQRVAVEHQVLHGDRRRRRSPSASTKATPSAVVTCSMTMRSSGQPRRAAAPAPARRTPPRGRRCRPPGRSPRRARRAAGRSPPSARAPASPARCRAPRSASWWSPRPDRA